jgi:hypothetical protein
MWGVCVTCAHSLLDLQLQRVDRLQSHTHTLITLLQSSSLYACALFPECPPVLGLIHVFSSHVCVWCVSYHESDGESRRDGRT